MNKQDWLMTSVGVSKGAVTTDIIQKEEMTNLVANSTLTVSDDSQSYFLLLTHETCAMLYLLDLLPS